jgi:hypothetical protein
LGRMLPPREGVNMIYLLTYYCLVAWVAGVFLYTDGFLYSRLSVALAPLAPVYIGGRAVLRIWYPRI